MNARVKLTGDAATIGSVPIKVADGVMVTADDSLKTALKDNSTQAQVDAAVTTLNTAVATFNAAEVF